MTEEASGLRRLTWVASYSADLPSVSRSRRDERERWARKPAMSVPSLSSPSCHWNPEVMLADGVTMLVRISRVFRARPIPASEGPETMTPGSRL